MVGTRGKGKASAAKSKRKAPSMVSDVPEPVVSEESSECPSDGEKKIQIPSTDEKENGDTTSGLVGGNGFEDNQQLADEGNYDEKRNVEKIDHENNDDENNDDEKVVIDELIANEVNSISEELEEVNDDDDATNDVDSENIGVDTEEENVEEFSDGGGAVNNFDVEDNEGKPDGKVEVEDKEPINDCGGDENIHTGEENEDIEVAEGGKIVTGQGLAASEYGVIDEMMSKEASDELNAEEPLSPSADIEETAEERENISVANNVKASTEEATKPKRKLIKKKLIKKVRKNDVASNNEAKPQSAIVNDASADIEETAEERENVSVANNVKASAEEANKSKRKLIKKKLIKKVHKNDVASNNEAKPQSAIVNDASGNDNSTEINKHEERENISIANNVDAPTEEAKKSKRKLIKKKLIKKVRKNDVAFNNEAKPQSAIVNDASGNDNSAETNKHEPTNIAQGTEALKETDKLEVEGEKAKKLGNKARRLKKKRKQKVKKDETTGNVVTGDTNKPGSSQKGIAKKVDTMGMIFMCSSETKKDCYHYKVLGLPAGKKDFVSKIYKGMRLFLFDVELKMLYGIYKAAAPGGFNIEPRAFKSKFPSQVRFTVLEECVPVAEEKFRRVIKKNYCTKNKFNCKLTSVQVRKLCKLFRETTKKADSTRIVRNPTEAAPSSTLRDKNRKRKRTEVGYKAGPASSSKRGRRHTEREPRRGPVVVGDRYYQRPVYEREAYLPPPAPPVQVMYQPLPPPSLPRPSYSYGGPTRNDIYRRVPALERVPVMDHRELGLSSLRRPADADRREPYASYRESRGAYLEPAYETGIRRELYEASARREHYDYSYSSNAPRVEYYSGAEYRPPLPPYRRY